MKRIAKLAALFLCAMLVAGAFAVAASAQEDSAQKVTVSVRIEGISENLYFGTHECNVGDSVIDVFSAIDKENDDITITGLDSGYITAVNGDGSGLTEVGYDGWMYRVDDKSPAVGMPDCKLTADTKSIVLYYSDEFVSGMQYPVPDISEIEEGKIVFKSTDTVYDESGNASEVVNPVAGMTVVWGYGNGQTASYTTDDNGTIVIDKAQLEDGNHSLAVSRVENNIPTVLRLQPDYKITLGSQETYTSDATSESESFNADAGSDTSAGETEKNTGKTENNGCKSAAGISVILAALAPCAYITLKKRNQND